MVPKQHFKGKALGHLVKVGTFHTPNLFYLEVEVSQVLSQEISWCKNPGILTGKGEEWENLPTGVCTAWQMQRVSPREIHTSRTELHREQNSHGAARTSHDLFTLTLNTFP